MDNSSRSPIDPTTQATLKFLAIRMMGNQFRLKKIARRINQLRQDEATTRREITQLKSRFNRELDANPKLRSDVGGEEE